MSIYEDNSHELDEELEDDYEEVDSFISDPDKLWKLLREDEEEEDDE